MKLFILFFLFSAQGFAQIVFESPKEQRVNWSVGTSATYKRYNHLSNKSEIFTASVTKVSKDRVWTELTYSGIHFVSIYDRNTGKHLELWANGELSQTANENEGQVVDSQITDITLPAGTYRSQYTKKKFNLSTVEQWIKLDRDSDTPFSMLKSIQTEWLSPTSPWQEFTLISEKIVR